MMGSAPLGKVNSLARGDERLLCLLEVNWIFLVISLPLITSITKTCLFKFIENFTIKKGKFSDKKFDIFHISAQNIDCGYLLEPPRRGGSNEYPQCMFWAEIRKIMHTPVNPSFTIQKWGLRGSKLYRYVFVMGDNFGNFLHTKSLLKRVCSKRKEFVPNGRKFFPFKVDIFSEGKKNGFDRVAFRKEN